MAVGLTVREFQRHFFDRKKVLSAVDRTTQRNLSRFGSRVRRTARSSIRRRKRASRPGQAPTNRKGQLKRFLFYAFEPRRRSVVIGPARLPGSKAIVPEILEHGGTISLSVTGKRRRRTRRVPYAARPFMQPAFDKELRKLPEIWRNSIQG